MEGLATSRCEHASPRLQGDRLGGFKDRTPLLDIGNRPVAPASGVPEMVMGLPSEGGDRVQNFLDRWSGLPIPYPAPESARCHRQKYPDRPAQWDLVRGLLAVAH